MLLNKINELNEIYEKIKETQKQNSLWKVNNEIFLALTDNNYSVIFIVEKKSDRKILSGKNMRIKLLDQIEVAFEDLSFIKPGILVECISRINEIKNAFLIFMTTLINNFEIFKQNAYEEFFKLWQLFERSRKRKDTDLKGFLGELFVIDYLFKKYNLDISNFDRKNEYNKWDFQFNEELFMEVKTTSLEERRHTFSYLQLNNSAEIIVSSVKILIHEKGLYLYNFAINLIKKN